MRRKLQIERLLEELKVAQDQRARGQRGRKHSTVMKSLRKHMKQVLKGKGK